MLNNKLLPFHWNSSCWLVSDISLVRAPRLLHETEAFPSPCHTSQQHWLSLATSSFLKHPFSCAFPTQHFCLFSPLCALARPSSREPSNIRIHQWRLDLDNKRATDIIMCWNPHFVFFGFKITMDSNCRHELKRHLLLGRKAMTDLDSIFKSRVITLLIAVLIVKTVVFPLVMYGCESWTMKNVESWKIDAFKLWCWRRLLRVPLSTRRSN